MTVAVEPRAASIRAWCVSYGPPALDVLVSRVAAAKAGDPLAPVSILVPTNLVGVSSRRLLAARMQGAGERQRAGGWGSEGAGERQRAGGGVAAISLLTVYRLAELLGAPRLAAAGRRPVSTPVLAAVARRVLSMAPGRFAPVADHPATEQALVAVHRDLSECTPEALDALAARGGRSAEVVRLHRMMKRVLSPAWYDEADLMAAGTAAVHAGSPLASDLGTVLVYLPQRLSLPAARLIRALAQAVPVEVIAGLTGVGEADAEVVRTLERLGVRESRPPVAPAPLPTEVVSVSDADEEVRAVVQRVVAAAREGRPLQRMAILYPQPEPYARIVHQHLTAAQIPFNGDAVRPLADRVLGRWLLDVLTLKTRGLRRQEVLGVLGSAPVRRGTGGRLPIARWERVSREAGVVRGHGDWDERLQRYAEQMRAAALEQAAGDNAPQWRAEALERLASDADALRNYVLRFARELRHGEGCRSWKALAGWCHGLIERYLGPASVRDDWPAPERVAAERIEVALDRIAMLDAVDDRPSLEALRRTLEVELDADLGRIGTFGDGVLVGRLSGALGIDLDAVYVLGLSEGTLPSPPREDSLLSDADRTRVAAELPPSTERAHSQHRQLLAALAAGRVTRVLVYPRGDLRRSADYPPSRWLLDAVAALSPQGPPRGLPRRAPWLEHVPSFASHVARVTVPATRQEYGLRVLSDHVRAGGELTDHPLVASDAALRSAVELVRARSSAAFTRFDGNLSALRAQLPSPASPDAINGPTRLEAWAACPHRYLMEHLLAVRPSEDPEELLEMAATVRGQLVHDVLEAWLRDLLVDGPPVPTDGWREVDRSLLASHAERLCEEYESSGVVGHRLLWQHDRARLLHDLQRFLNHDDATRAELHARPLAAEFEFGNHELPPVEIALPDGREIRFCGRVDRLDRASDGRLLVTDYKTGRDTGYQGLSADDPHQGGRRLQLPVYALAARQHQHAPDAPVRADYWFVTSRGGFRRIGYDVDASVLDAFAGALHTIVTGIEQGVFPAHPPEPGWRPYIECHYCDPDGLGTAERWRTWERKRSDPALASYVRLVEQQ